MLPEDVDKEIDKLKVRIIELTNMMNMSTSFDDKEALKADIDIINKQIEIIEKMKA